MFETYRAYNLLSSYILKRSVLIGFNMTRVALRSHRRVQILRLVECHG